MAEKKLIRITTVAVVLLIIGLLVETRLDAKMLDSLSYYFPVAEVQANILSIILAGSVIGYIFSTIGGCGGILTLITQVVFFGITNVSVIIPINLSTTILCPIVSSITYLREKRVAIPLVVNLSIPVVAGALIGPWISVHYLTLKPYLFWFGVMAFGISIRLFYESTERYKMKKGKLKRATEKFEIKVRELRKSGKWSELKKSGFEVKEWNFKKLRFKFWGEEFSISSLGAGIGAFAVAIVTSMLGVGGGFLFVPLLSSVFVLPMFLVTGTAILVIFINSLIGIIRYTTLGNYPDPMFTALLLVGAAIGSYIGPRSQKYYPERYLRLILAMILIIYSLRFMGVWRALGIPI